MERQLKKPAASVFSLLPTALVLAGSMLLAACGGDDDNDGPVLQPVDRVAEGQNVFRFETFGNEAFWTDAMQLPQGIAGAGVTPLDALALGLNVNVEALSPATAEALLEALDRITNEGADPNDTVLANPAVTLALINEGAVIGVVPFDENGNRKPLGSSSDFDAGDSLDIAGGDKVGVTCALCHARTDDSIVPAGFAGPGSVGVEVDGVVAEGLDVGAIFAAANNPLAYLPLLQLQFDTLEGATIGNGDFAGISSADSIADATAAARTYLTGTDGVSGERYYSLTSFDATPDGIGNATYVPPFFRTDLAAPWGHSGAFENLDDFNNLVYTVALDPTSLLTDEGRAFLNVLAGPVGDEIAGDYQQVLEDTGVIDSGMAISDQLPLVNAARDDLAPGSPAGPVGRRVAEGKLTALSAYTDQLAAPPAPDGLEEDRVARGEALFTSPRSEGGAGCAGCHTADPNQAVENRVIAIDTLYRAYNDNLAVLLDRSMAGLSPLQDAQGGPAPAYDNSLIVLDASVRGLERGFTKPLLLALDSKDEFLHDGSVVGADAVDGLEQLLNPARGENAPHPFYYPRDAMVAADDEGRRDLVEYLRSRTTD